MIRHPRVWPDATEVLAAGLSHLGVPVRWTIPNPRDRQFIVVRRVGGGSGSWWYDAAEFDVECWSGDPHSNPRPAHHLANRVREAILQLPTRDKRVRDSRCSGPAWLPDADSATPRTILAARLWIAPREGE